MAAVEAGERTEAMLTWWGFDAEDSTRYLQAALDSRASQIIVPRMETAWKTEPIFINRDNVEVFFQPGVVVKARAGAFRGRNDSMFTIRDRENIVFRGYGATLRMRRDDYLRNPYARAEWRMLISINGSSNVQILGLTLDGSGGDGIYIGRGERSYSRDIVIREVTAMRNLRQAISVISVENLLIEESVLKDTYGTAPGAGIDFEPNRADERLVNVVMRNVVTENNSVAGILIFLSHLTSDSIPVSMRFENYISRHDFLGVYIRRLHREDSVGGKIEFVNCRIENSLRTALSIDHKHRNSAELVFDHCRLTGSRATPLVFNGGEEWGGIRFNEMVIEDWSERPFAAVGGGGQLAGLQGGLLVRAPDTGQLVGQAIVETLSEAGLRVRMESAEIPRPPIVNREKLSWLDRFQPRHDRKLEEVPNPVRIRNTQAYALYADQGERVELALETSIAGRTAEFEVLSPTGKVVDYSLQDGIASWQVEFTAAETGLYLLGFASPYTGNTLEIRTRNRLSLLPHSFNQRDVMNQPYLAGTGRFYFWVPPGDEQFYLKIQGWGRQGTVAAVLYDDHGSQVEAREITGRTQQVFVVDPEDSANGSVWSVEIERSGGVIEFFAPIPPVVAFHPDALLIPED